MAILLCNECGHLREVRSEYAGKSVICPQCKQDNAVHDTIRFLKYLIGKYREKNRELQSLKEQLAPVEQEESVDAAESEDSTIAARQLLSDVDIHNTTTLADPQQYRPIVTWMNQRGIRLDIDHQAIDTTGFFDEVAVRLGDGYETLKLVSNQIKFIHQKGYTNVKLTLSKSSEAQIADITDFCRQLHDYSFVSRYLYNRKEKTVHMTLQTAPAIVRFFLGEWMEWFVFMKVLNSFLEQGVPVSCLRRFHVNFPNEDKFEIDGFFLIGNEIPVCIECKTGEFRQDIKKFSLLRKKLNLDRTQFLVCAIGLNETQIQGFNSMYDVTFANESNFLQYVQRLVP